jgi:hypothetical protein
MWGTVVMRKQSRALELLEGPIYSNHNIFDFTKFPILSKYSLLVWTVLTFVALLDGGNLIVVLRTNIVWLLQIAFTFLMPFENSESGTLLSEVHCGIIVRKILPELLE